MMKSDNQYSTVVYFKNITETIASDTNRETESICQETRNDSKESVCHVAAALLSPS